MLLSDLDEKVLPSLPKNMSWAIGSNGRKDYLMIVSKRRVWSKAKIRYPFINALSAYMAISEVLLKFDKNRTKSALNDYAKLLEDLN